MYIDMFKVFCDLAETGSFSKAAALNGITQSAVSQQVRAVEDKFQVRLVERGRKIALTAAGLKFLEEARRTIEVSQKLGSSNVRIFGGGDLKSSTHAELAQVGLDCMRAILELDGASEMHWLFETHDNWIKASDCKLLLDKIDNPSFGALWDMGHTSRVGGETPEQSYAAIGPRIGYTHVKDAVYDPKHPQAMDDGWRRTMIELCRCGTW